MYAYFEEIWAVVSQMDALALAALTTFIVSLLCFFRYDGAVPQKNIEEDASELTKARNIIKSAARFAVVAILLVLFLLGAASSIAKAFTQDFNVGYFQKIRPVVFNLEIIFFLGSYLSVAWVGDDKSVFKDISYIILGIGIYFAFSYSQPFSTWTLEPENWDLVALFGRVMMVTAS